MTKPLIGTGLITRFSTHSSVGPLTPCCEERLPQSIPIGPELSSVFANTSRAKIIVCLRHPSYRAHSHWRMERQRGLDHLSFSEAIRSGRKRVRDASRGVHRVYSYVERGFYASQLRRLLVNFSSQNILPIRNDRLWANPKLEMWRVYDFLGVDSLLGEAGREHITPLDAPEATPMSLVDRTYLDALFVNDIVETDRPFTAERADMANYSTDVSVTTSNQIVS